MPSSESSAARDSRLVAGDDHGARAESPTGQSPSKVPEGQECPTCFRRVPKAKKPTSPKTKVVSIRVPIDDAETFQEMLEAAAKNADLHESGHWQYWTVLRGLIHVLQEVPTFDNGS